jgi:nitrogen fixation protein FixH
MTNPAVKPFTGYHMAAILIGFFGIVIAVNIYMAKVAVGTFGGTVVDNSYVASQNYNKWLAEAGQEAKLGWNAKAERIPNGRLKLSVTDNGTVGIGFAVEAEAQHPLGRLPNRTLSFTSLGDGSYLSRETLPAGRWQLRIVIARDSNQFRIIAEIQ